MKLNQPGKKDGSTSAVCRVGVVNAGCPSSTSMGPSNDCKGVFNEASLTPWCHAVVHLEVNMSRFSVSFQDDRPKSLRQSPLCHVGVPNEGRWSSKAIGLSSVFKGASLAHGATPWPI